ncbi:MAG: hypothetical protein DSY35_01770 [Desulfurobacterium sp.]|nr:MAG: hypothetical protein DSY35_01770 [Desulfurobacterium sp.]
MGKEWIKEEITFWKELFSFFSKVLILIVSGVIVDIKSNNKASGTDFLGFLVAVLFLIALLFILAKWRKNIRLLKKEG